MKRRNFLRNSVLTAGALTLTQKNLLAALFEDPWKITMLRENVGIFTERGGTIGFLLSKNDIVVVDSQFPEQSLHFIEAIKKRSEKPIRLLINSHHHGDHSSGNISFKGVVDHVLAHENSKINQQNWAKQNKSEDKQLYPDQTFTNTWREKHGKEWVALHYFGAAHTNGDSLIHFEHADIIHMGDLHFNRRHPNVDRAAGASIKSWIEVLNKTLGKFPRKTIYIYGHAANGHEVTGSEDDLQAFRDYLGNVLKFVESEMKAGKSRDEILKATTIPGSDEWKGDGIQRPLGAAYDELLAG